jgi:CBS domain-containing protein
MLCEEIMTEGVASVESGQTVRDAARLMSEHDVGFIPVCQTDESVIGTLTDRDIVIRVIAQDLPLDTKVEDVMSTELVTCHVSDDVSVAEERMQSHQVNRILVMDDDGKLAGVISLANLAAHQDEERVGETPAEIRTPQPSVP